MTFLLDVGQQLWCSFVHASWAEQHYAGRARYRCQVTGCRAQRRFDSRVLA